MSVLKTVSCILDGVAVWCLRCRGPSTPHCTALHCTRCLRLAGTNQFLRVVLGSGVHWDAMLGENLSDKPAIWGMASLFHLSSCSSLFQSSFLIFYAPTATTTWMTEDLRRHRKQSNYSYERASVPNFSLAIHVYLHSHTVNCRGASVTYCTAKCFKKSRRILGHSAKYTTSTGGYMQRHHCTCLKHRPVFD